MSETWTAGNQTTSSAYCNIKFDLFLNEFIPKESLGDALTLLRDDLERAISIYE